DAINNKSGRGRALSGAVGITFERPEGVRRAIEGLELLMDDAFHPDGFCTESPSYSDMHLNVMRPIPEVLRGYSDPEGYVPEEGESLKGFDPFQAFDRYRLALESMVRMLDPRLKYPVIGDTHAGEGLQTIHAEILADRYGPRYAGLLERVQDAPLAEAGSEYALWNRDPDLKVQEEADLPLRTEWFPGWHVAVLRGGRDLRGHTAFYLNGYAHGGHRHRDTLSAIYIAHGQEMASDRGYIWDDPRNAWTGSTLAHNLVTVDGDSQNGEGCHSTLELFGQGPGVEAVQASANAYSQCDRYQRTCVLVEIPGGGSYAIDLFRVRGGNLHQYGFQCNGKLVGVEGAALESAEDEIEWLNHIRAGLTGGPAAVTWAHAGVHMDLRVLGPIDRLLAADAPGWRSSKGDQLHAPAIQQVLAERSGDGDLESRFAAVVSPYPEGSGAVKGARLLLDDAQTGAMAVVVEREGRTDYLLSSPEGIPCDAGPVTMAGRLGFVSVDAAGQATRAYLLGGTRLTCGDLNLNVSEAETRLKVRSTEGRTFHMAEDVPSDVEGRCVLAGETGFEIESATPSSITVRDYPAIECEVVRILNGAEFENGEGA
ncbi:MAG: heparinase II/III family protein, partial [Candidatus Latescibacteria bacterium]|nr:heparinase II/III family protein [Candidatus Latescibacterota bacterium]